MLAFIRNFLKKRSTETNIEEDPRKKILVVHKNQRWMKELKEELCKEFNVTEIRSPRKAGRLLKKEKDFSMVVVGRRASCLIPQLKELFDKETIIIGTDWCFMERNSLKRRGCDYVCQESDVSCYLQEFVPT